MEKLIVLGTGHAMTIDCYNTCFAIQNNYGEYLLVDTGGGNAILKNLRDSNIDLCKIHNLVISHKHSDHTLGLIWIIRALYSLISSNKYNGNLNVFVHSELEKDIRMLCASTLPESFIKLIDNRIILKVISEKEVVEILNYNVEFFDVHAKKDKQFGFKTDLENGKSIVFLGDEPFNSNNEYYVKNTDYLLHEAFCLDSQADIFKPYEKHHSTVKTACKTAQRLKTKNLILWHSEDSNLKNRKKAYIEEGKNYFKGKIFVPNDLDVIEL